jgi:ABC-type antimicrobial peptide transport system permease subunit
VLWTVLRDCLIVAAIGITLGAGVSLALGRYVRTLLFQISATDVISLAGAGALMLAVATLAGLLPARRAAAVDPAAALRGD